MLSSALRVNIDENEPSIFITLLCPDRDIILYNSFDHLNGEQTQSIFQYRLKEGFIFR